MINNIEHIQVLLGDSIKLCIIDLKEKIFYLDFIDEKTSFRQKYEKAFALASLFSLTCIVSHNYSEMKVDKNTTLDDFRCEYESRKGKYEKIKHDLERRENVKKSIKNIINPNKKTREKDLKMCREKLELWELKQIRKFLWNYYNRNTKYKNLEYSPYEAKKYVLKKNNMV